MTRALAALLAVALGCGCTCGSGDEGETRGKRAGAALAASLAAAVAQRDRLRAPYRCARLDRTPGDLAPPVLAGGRTLEREGRLLRLGGPGADRTLVLGAIADARGDAPRTLAALEAVAQAFSEGGVEVVLSLGGMGRDEDELAAVLGALARAGDWLVVAVPGDREAVPAHRRAVAALRESGLAVVDGADIRLLEADGAVVATLPGVEARGQLVAGPQGCAHTDDDAAALAASLAAAEGTKVWAGYAAPRQQAAGGSDLVDGVHAGERVLAEPLARSGAQVVLHGQIDDAALGEPRGTARLSAKAPAFLGTGALEAVPVTGWRDEAVAGAALIAEIGPRRLRWRRVRLPAGGR